MEKNMEKTVEKAKRRMKKKARSSAKASARKRHKEQPAAKVSYVRKPVAHRSRISMGTALVSLVFFAAGLGQGVKTQGRADLSAAAFGLCSLIFSVTSVVYALSAFLEKERNYILAKISIVVGILLTGAWIFMIAIGIGG